MIGQKLKDVIDASLLLLIHDESLKVLAKTLLIVKSRLWDNEQYQKYLNKRTPWDGWFDCDWQPVVAIK